jgi:dTMP kinase
VLIAIEGIDGSGKGTQASLLKEKLEKDGKTVTLLRFPRYEQTFFGDYGTLEQVPAHLSSLLYALDRFESIPLIQKSLANGEIVICDRYMGSNMAHQAARMPPENQADTRAWIKKVEQEILGVPKADVIFFLDMAVDDAQRLVGQKEKRSYTDKTHDLHEASSSHLSSALENFRSLSNAEGWEKVSCLNLDGQLRGLSSICEEIYDRLIHHHAF